MDLICVRCGEPWDLDSLHDAGRLTFDQARERFYREGCGVWGIDCEDTTSMRTDAAAMLYDLLGDDVDGAAAMLEDFDIMGGF